VYTDEHLWRILAVRKLRLEGEGLDAISEVEAHFTDILDTLRADKVSPIKLLDAAEDFRVLNRIEYLMVVVAQLRRRLSQAAGKMRERSR
jgi:hypothetical protein